MNQLPLFIGTYTDGTGSDGIYRADFVPEDGSCGKPVLAAACRQPSFLLPDPARRRLYAVREVVDGEEDGGYVDAYAVAEDGRLNLLATAATGGGAPCHLAMTPGGEQVWVANYVGGSVCCLPVDDGPAVWGERTRIRHRGDGPDPERQKTAHPHATAFAPDGHVVVADLGCDALYVYAPERRGGDLVTTCPLAPGAGPRHMVFHPSGSHLYVVGELDNSVTVVAWSPAPPRPVPLGSVPTIRSEHVNGNLAADIHMHPDGRAVYVSNRGHDNLAVFAVEDGGARLEAVGHVSSGGAAPRGFRITPDGDWLLAANQDGDNLSVLHLPQRAVLPKPTELQVPVPAPTCVVPWTG